MSRHSRFLSLILRHKPEEIGITLDRAGWTRIDELLRALKTAGRPISREQLIAIVEENEKRRFTVSEDGAFIRAAQGHSIDVDLGLQPRKPPLLLYHGTARQSLDEIFSQGLQSMGRGQVHLSSFPTDAAEVGRRHGHAVVLEIMARRMHRRGFVFTRADNGVWLTEAVPASFLQFWSGGASSNWAGHSP